MPCRMPWQLNLEMTSCKKSGAIWLIVQHWQELQPTPNKKKKPESYKSKAAFAKDMLTKCEKLDSQKVIEDWSRAWEKSSKSAG